jgi:plasmid stability protein
VTTLTDVDLELRVRAAREVIHGERGLSVIERCEILAAALWPAPVRVPEAARTRRAWPVELRQEAVAAYLSGAGSALMVARRFGVPAPTLKNWVRRARTVASNAA